MSEVVGTLERVTGASLDPKLAATLLRIADADGGEFQEFTPLFNDASDNPMHVMPPIDGAEDLAPGRMRELERLGYLQIDPPSSGNPYGPFRLTSPGVAMVRRIQPVAGGGPAVSTWPVVEPIRDAIYELWVAADSPQFGIEVSPETVAPGLTPEQLRGALTYLRDGDRIDYRDALGPTLPMGVRPTQRTIEELGHWPTKDPNLLADRMLEALEIAIADTDDPEVRTRLQRAREALGDVSKTVVGGLALAVGKQVTGL